MKQDELENIENELKKRLNFPYEWGRKQNDVWDKHSSYIYTTTTWEVLIEKSEEALKTNELNRRGFLNYTYNRWYNFWSAVAVENLFTTIPGIVPEVNKRNRSIDFEIFGTAVDLKTSVFPSGFGKSLEFCKQHPKDLISWLYKNQSMQQRQHFANRLFLIVFSEGGDHWKLKAEISWLKQIIEEYVANYDQSQLHEFKFEGQKTTLSDIIWAIK